MAIVLNEYEWAEKMIHDRNLGSRPTETLNRVAKYYYENRYSKREIRKLLDQFLVSCDPDASLFSWSNTLDKITKNAGKYDLVQIDYIPVMQNELNAISALGTHLEQRLAFTLLCVSKYWDSISDRNNHWVNSPDKEIFTMANISVSSKRQDLLYGKLLEAGLIRQSKKIDNLNVQVTFCEEFKENPVLLIRDFRNLGHQYMRFMGGPYFECVCCGVTTKLTERKVKLRDSRSGTSGRKQKYCPSCAAEIRMKQNVDAVMRRRKQSK